VRWALFFGFQGYVTATANFRQNCVDCETGDSGAAKLSAMERLL
jgi:hypothetical protein